ncbi:VOC family protein [Leifsonia shinshuensis]|uniref:VOC family protein n=1 Tax=Leifsonia shinshuensis TaxID=150026 RepID=A0A7G6YCF7_9MICO|nr:VOC family protein [Leifsonia shinshuensis]QNE36172.1 VOC family protein [Leifsonia shinshuensis]
MTAPVTLQRIVVSTRSIPAALSLYGGALGLEVGRRAGDLAWLTSADGVEVMLHEREARPSDTAVAIGFAVDRLDDTVAAWVAAGGALVDPPERQPWGERMAVVRDADGHLVCLSERA